MRYRDLVEAAAFDRRLLFHGTKQYRLAGIMASNRLEARTTDVAVSLRGATGVSLTREFEYARRFPGQPATSVVLVLNAAKLATQPVDYWKSANGSRIDRPDEAEEFHTGPLAPLSRYLLGIVSEQSFDAWLAKITSLVAGDSWKLYTPKAEQTAILRALKAGFPLARSKWNSWAP